MRKTFTILSALSFLAAIGLVLVACTGRELTEDEKAAYAAKEKAWSVAANADKTERGARDQQIAQASSNLGPLSQAVTAKGETALGLGIEAQKRDIDNALGIPLDLYPPPVVDLNALLKDAQGALKTYKAKSDELQTKLDKAAREAAAANEAKLKAEAIAENEKKKADAAESREWWYKVGAGALTVLGAGAALAARLGLPGGGLLSMAMDVITPAVKARRVTAETAVAAADVGRQGLAVLETYLAQNHPELATQLSTVVSTATGGRADGLNALFKTAAKAYVIDNHGAQAEAVDSLLTDVRGRAIRTEGGLATALQAILPAAKAG